MRTVPNNPRPPATQGKNQDMKTRANKSLRDVTRFAIIHARIAHHLRGLPIKPLSLFKANPVLGHVGLIFRRIVVDVHTVICIYK